MNTLIGFICGLILGAFSGVVIGTVLIIDYRERKEEDILERWKHDILYQSRTSEAGDTDIR